MTLRDLARDLWRRLQGRRTWVVVLGVAVLAIVALAVLSSVCAPPTREVETHEATTEAASLRTLLAELERERAAEVHEEVVEERRSDGSSTVRRVRDEKAREVARASSAETATAARLTTTKDTREVVRERPRNRLELMAGWRPRSLETSPAEVTVAYTRRLVGPLSAGAFVRVERAPVAVAAGFVVAAEW